MKKLISAVLTGAMLLAGASSVLASDPAPASGVGLEIKDGAFLKLDGETGRLVLLNGTTSVSKLKDGFVSAVTVADSTGKMKADGDAVATGDTVSAGVDSAEVLLYGDVNGDGAIDLADAVMMLRRAAGQNVDIDKTAADVTPDGTVDTADVVKMLRYAAGWEVSLGDVRMVAENKAKLAPAEDSSIDIFFETPLTKIPRSQTESTGRYTYKMGLAKNETESVQVFLATDKKYEGLSIELSEWEYEFDHGSGEHTGALKGEILWEYYYNLSHAKNILTYIHGDTLWSDDYYVDPLPPIAETFELSAGCSQGFMINVTSEKDAPAGMYRATVDVKDQAGNIIKTAYVYAYVWDFMLPDTPYSVSAFGTGAYNKPTGPNMYPVYYEFMLEQNLSPYIMPYLITDPRAEAIMNDPRVTSFIIAGSGNGGAHDRTDENIIESYKMLKENPEWFKKGYFYFVDEPGHEGVYEVGRQYERLANLVGDEDFRVVVPLAHDTIIDPITGLDAIEYMKPYVNIWCPQSMGFVDLGNLTYNDPNFTPARAHMMYGSTVERFTEIRLDPKNDFWWYICCQPQYPWPNFYNCYEGNMNRVVLWQQYMLEIEGLLYWTVSNWANVTKRSTESDGCLIYWKELFGFNEGGPVSSYRMVQVRDAFDDFDYMSMAEELYGREAVMEIVNTVTTGVLEVNEDYHAMIEAREALAAMLDGNYK